MKIKEKLKRDGNNEPLPTFSPVVNQRSHDLKRQENIDLILYEDAIRRQNKRSVSPEYKSSKFMSQNSEKLLTEKFNNEYHQLISDIYGYEKDEFTYTEFVAILDGLFFIKNDCDDP